MGSTKRGTRGGTRRGTEPYLGGGAAALLGLLGGALAWPFTVDDAFILGRYARHLAQGLGYSMRPGHPSDGVTGPLGLLPGWLGASLGLDPVLASKAAGLLAASLAFGLVIERLLRGALGRRGLPLALAAGLVGPTLCAWGQAGLETGLATLALTLAYLGVSARPRPHLGGVALALACLPWLRPELVPIGGLLALLPLLSRRRRRAALPLIGLAAGLLGVALFRLALFDHPLPLSALAKPPLPRYGAPYALRALLLWIGPAGALLLAREARRGPRLRAIAGLIGAHGVAVVLAGGDWMPGYRLFAPLSPLLALGLGLAFARATLRLPRAGAIALALALIAPWALDACLQWPELRASAAPRLGAGSALAAALRPYRRVAMVDVGYLAYRSGVEVIDLGGITDEEIARLPGAHLDKAIPAELLMGRQPGAILLHAAAPPIVRDGRLMSLAGYPVERRLARMPWVRERFRVLRIYPYTANYLYVLLVPAEDLGSSLRADHPEDQAEGEQAQEEDQGEGRQRP